MSEDFHLDNEDRLNGAGDPDELTGRLQESSFPKVPPGGGGAEPAGPPTGGEPFPGFLELVYGVLFEPRKAMKKVAERPPLGQAVLVVTIITLLGAVMGLLTMSKVISQSFHTMAMDQYLPGLRAFAPLGVILGLLWGYAKWFGYSAIMHLAADLLGGRGSARGVFAAAGLAGLPSIIMIPVQFLSYWFGAGSMTVTILVGLAGLAVGVWSIVITVIGLKQVHGLSTGRSVLVVLSPALAILALLIFAIIALVVIASSMPGMTVFPGYF